MFKVVNELLNKNNHSLPDCNSCEDLADQFCDFFNNKIDKIHEVVDNANLSENLSSYISSNHSNCSMSTFQYVTPEDLKKVIMKCPIKSCDLDPLPTWLIKNHLPTIVPTLCQVVNLSLSTGCFPSVPFKAIVTPILKKPTLDRQ